MSDGSAATPETELVLIGGEKLRIKGSVDENATVISRGLDPERSGWVILELVDGDHVRVRAGAVAYVRDGEQRPAAPAEPYVVRAA